MLYPNPSERRMEMSGKFSCTDVPPALAELVASLEHSALMAKRLTTATDPSHLQQIYNSLATAHQHLSSFLYRNPNLPAPLPPDENSESSAINSNAEPMQVGDEEEEEVKSGSMIGQVEEKMRNFFIKNKRSKTPISPSSAAEAEQTRLCQDELGLGSRFLHFDPNATRLRNLEETLGGDNY